MKTLIFVLLSLPLCLFAEDKKKKLGWKHDSTLGFVVQGGNSTAETFNFKQETAYKFESSIVKWSGNYLNAKAKDQGTGITSQTAENWATLLRYDRIHSERLASYLQTGISGDRFQGLREKKEVGLGGKFYSIKKEYFTWSKEFGYQYARELYVQDTKPDDEQLHQEFHFARAATDAKYAFKKDMEFGLSAEYLYPFADQQLDREGQKDRKDYRINFSPYFKTVLSDLLSLKIAYEGKYRNIPVADGNAYLDFTYTTSLIASY